jgi:1,4-dihydroxy-2-naphthoate octaprenyltransferase
MGKISLWIKATRAPFFQASIIPVLVGTVMAYRDGHFDLILFILTLVAILGIHVGTNVSNDYFDHLSGNDEINLNLTPFSGGSRVIQEGLIAPRTILSVALAGLAVGTVIGIYLSFKRGLALLPIGAAGVFLGYFYTARPIQYGYRGVGELLVGVLLGPLSVMGAYFVQTQRFGIAVFLASIPIGLLVALILYINEFPDYDADRAVNKRHLIVRLGRKRASRGYLLIMAGIYLSVIIPVVLKIFPLIALLILLTLPIGINAIRVAMTHYDDPRKIIPAQAQTIALHLSIGLLLCIGFFIDTLT